SPLRSLLEKKRHDHGRVLPVLCRLLLRHLARRLAHLLGGNVASIHFGDHSLARSPEQIIAKIAWNKSDHHGRANEQQQTAQHNFLERTLSLQKSNHLLTAPSVKCEFIIINHPKQTTPTEGVPPV